MHDSESFPFEHACRRSGNCCSRPEGRVRVLPEELAGLAAATGLSAEGFVRRYCVPGPGGSWLLKAAPSGPACVFLERDGAGTRCRVYPARPGHCRSFPHWPELRAPGPALEAFLRFCPGATRRESETSAPRAALPGPEEAHDAENRAPRTPDPRRTPPARPRRPRPE